MNAVQQPIVINVTIGSQPPVSVTVPASSTAVSSPVAKPVLIKSLDLHRVNLQDFLFKQVGKFVTLDFIKVDGQGRSLNGRLGVRKHLRGGINTVAAAERPYLVVYDVKTKGYRAVNLATVIQVRAQKAVYQIIG